MTETTSVSDSSASQSNPAGSSPNVSSPETVSSFDTAYSGDDDSSSGSSNMESGSGSESIFSPVMNAPESDASSNGPNDASIYNPAYDYGNDLSVPAAFDLSDTDAGTIAEVNASPIGLDPILIDGTVEPRTPDAQELAAAAERAQERLNNGDRAGAYLELYEVTGNEQLVLQAQITTYSGALGGMALEGNFRAKMANPDQYTITLDQFSHEIDQAVVTEAATAAELGRPEDFDKRSIMDADSRVWAKNQMTLSFPGNAQYMGIEGMEHLAQSIGSEEAILAQDEIELGRRPAEYANDPRFTIETSNDGRFVSVVNNDSNRIEVFYDTQFESDKGEAVDGLFTPDLEQVENESPLLRVVAEREMKMDFLQAGTLQPYAELPEFDAQAPRPPENLDRVFSYNGVLYQASDRAQFEKDGVDFGDLTDTGWTQTFEGLDYVNSLNEVGVDVERVVEDRGFWTQGQRDRAFQQLLSDGVITPLTGEQTQYYTDTLESLREQGLMSPYQSTDDAMRALGNELAPGLMYLGENEIPDGNTEVVVNANPASDDPRLSGTTRS